MAVGKAIEVRTGPELARITAELKRVAATKELQKQLRKELRAAASPIVPAVRASIDQIPSHSDAPKLRKSLKAATKLSIKTTGKDAGILVRVDGRKMPEREGRLPSYMEGERKPWRHPVFGDRQVWVAQDPYPYFYSVVKSYGPIAVAAIDTAMAKVALEVT